MCSCFLSMCLFKIAADVGFVPVCDLNFNGVVVSHQEADRAVDRLAGLDVFHEEIVRFLTDVVVCNEFNAILNHIVNS